MKKRYSRVDSTLEEMKKFSESIKRCIGVLESGDCQCEGCKISRDPNSGYQPCHNYYPDKVEPPQED